MEQTEKQGRGLDAKTLTAQISAGVESVYTSGTWKEALAYNARFWSYSFRNQMLIAMQAPGASQVAGFHTWKALGRSVKKGEKGLAILAPMFAGKTPKEGKDGKDVKPGALFGFRVAYVFDVDQTDGKPAPEVTHKLKGAAPAGLWEGLTAYAAGLGVSVAFGAMAESCGGFVRPVKDGETGAAAIVINEKNDGLQQVKTLIHELTHFLAGHLEKRGLELSHDARELEAESGAYIVGAVLGVDFSEYSFGYLAHWAKDFEDKEARNKALEKAGAKAAEVAKKILAGLDPAPVKAEA